MNPINIPVRCSGRYTFKITNKKTGVEKNLPAKADNLLLISFFRESLSNRNQSEGFMSGIVVGSGTTPPVVTDTSLELFVAGTATQQGAVIPNVVNATVYPRYVTRAMTKRFNGSALAGAPLTEVGVAITTNAGTTPNASTPLASRALITDTEGNPTSITVLADEYLDVTYEMTTYALDGVTGTLSINIDGTVEDFGYEIRPISMNSTTAWPQASFSSGTAILSAKSFPSASTISGQFTAASDVDTFEDPASATQPPELFQSDRSFTSYKQAPVWDESDFSATGILTLPLNNGNFSEGIKSFLLNFGFNSPSGNRVLGMHRMILDRPIPKNANRIFEFPIKLSMSNASTPGV